MLNVMLKISAELEIAEFRTMATKTKITIVKTFCALWTLAFCSSEWEM